MAKETTKRTTSLSERYVVERLKKVEQELEQLRSFLAKEQMANNDLYELLKKIGKEIKVEIESSDTFIHISVHGNYIESIYKNPNLRNEKDKEFYRLVCEIKRRTDIGFTLTHNGE